MIPQIKSIPIPRPSTLFSPDHPLTSIRVPLPSLLAVLPSTPLWLGPVLAPRLLALSHSLGGSPGCSLSPFLVVVGSTGRGRLEGPVLVVASRSSGIRRLAVPSDEDSWLVIIDVAECSSPFVGRWEGHIRRTHPQEEAVVDAALRRSRGSVAFLLTRRLCAAAEESLSLLKAVPSIGRQSNRRYL